MRLAASRTFCTAGSSRPISTAIMAMTTSSSISVNADRRTVRPREGGRAPPGRGIVRLPLLVHVERGHAVRRPLSGLRPDVLAAVGAVAPAGEEPAFVEPSAERARAHVATSGERPLFGDVVVTLEIYGVPRRS